MAECSVCWSPDGRLLQACRCASRVHVECQMQVLPRAHGRCNVCLADYTPEAMMQVIRRALALSWAQRKHYCYCWALVRAGHAETALVELRSIDDNAFEDEPSVRATCHVLTGRALLQLQRIVEALRSFQQAVMRLEVLPCPLIDVNVFANAKIGLGVAYTKIANYVRAGRALAEALKLSAVGSHATLMKAYQSSALLANAQGLHLQAWGLLLKRHKIALEISRDIVLHAETLAEVHISRSQCSGNKVAPEAMQTLLRNNQANWQSRCRECCRPLSCLAYTANSTGARQAPPGGRATSQSSQEAPPVIDAAVPLAKEHTKRISATNFVLPSLCPVSKVRVWVCEWRTEACASCVACNYVTHLICEGSTLGLTVIVREGSNWPVCLNGRTMPHAYTHHRCNGSLACDVSTVRV